MHTVRFTLLQKRRLIVPLPPNRFRSEPKNQGIVKLAETLGPNLATVLGAEGKYAHLLQNEFKNKPVARVIEGSEHYPDLFRELDQLLENTQKIIRSQQASEKG
jgi:hypothetical protein